MVIHQWAARLKRAVTEFGEYNSVTPNLTRPPPSPIARPISGLERH